MRRRFRHAIARDPLRRYQISRIWLEAGLRAPKGRGLLLIPRWDLTEQFTKNAHNPLTLVYQDQERIELVRTDRPRVVLLSGAACSRKAIAHASSCRCERRAGQAGLFIAGASRSPRESDRPPSAGPLDILRERCPPETPPPEPEAESRGLRSSHRWLFG